MIRIPNMRIEVTRDSAAAVLAAGGCVSHLGTGDVNTVYAEGKPDHLARMIERVGVTTVGDMHKVPNFRNEPGAYL